MALSCMSWKDRLRGAYPEIGSQLLKSGTSIGANIREAKFAESKKDCRHKLKIGLKEAEETQYWFELLSQANYSCTSELNDLRVIIAILVRLTKNRDKEVKE